MAGYRCVHVLVTVDGATVGSVDSMTMDLEFDGGLENVYGNVWGMHGIGGKKATFTLRRWYWVDSDNDLFIDIFNGNVPFNLAGQISGDVLSKITLSNCIAYKYRPVFGAPNDKVGEELSGEASNWVLP